MKKNLHQSLTIFMAMLVLLSSTGFAFIEHECMMRGKSLQFFTEKKDDAAKKVASCCAKSKVKEDSKGTFFKKTDCCKESHKFEKVDVPSQGTQLTKWIKALSDGVVWSATSFQFLQAEWITPSFAHSANILSFSSLFHGRSMLSFVQSFLI